tara:strand:+ start:525 stop:686 length:162 start_codon:yes stop_codon:yes gene_type:complete
MKIDCAKIKEGRNVLERMILDFEAIHPSTPTTEKLRELLDYLDEILKENKNTA